MSRPHRFPMVCKIIVMDSDGTPSGELPLLPEPYLSIDDEVRARDRSYFVDHPDAPEYEREQIQGEFWPDLTDPTATSWTIVRRVTQASRFRELWDEVPRPSPRPPAPNKSGRTSKKTRHAARKLARAATRGRA